MSSFHNDSTWRSGGPPTKTKDRGMLIGGTSAYGLPAYGSYERSKEAAFTKDKTFLTAVDFEQYGAYTNETSQSTLLLKKKKMLQEVQEELDKKKAEYEGRMRTCKEREDEVLAKQERIRESVLRFEKFVRENDLKRARAIKKEREESQLRMQKEAEIERLREDLANLLARKEEYKNMLDRLGVYEAYLEACVEASTDFTELNDILMRHGTLVASNTEMRVSIEESMNEKEILRQSLSTYSKEVQDALLMKTSSVAGHQKMAEMIKSANDKMESEKEHRQVVFNTRKRTLGEARLAIANVYLRCKRAGVPAENTGRTFKLLEYMVQRMGDLGLITHEFTEHKRERERRAKIRGEHKTEVAPAPAPAAPAPAPAVEPAPKTKPYPVPPPTTSRVEDAAVAGPVRPEPA
ncbi:FAP-73 protein [Pseudoscourfieldia marina]